MRAPRCATPTNRRDSKFSKVDEEVHIKAQWNAELERTKKVRPPARLKNTAACDVQHAREQRCAAECAQHLELEHLEVLEVRAARGARARAGGREQSVPRMEQAVGELRFAVHVDYYKSIS